MRSTLIQCCITPCNPTYLFSVSMMSAVYPFFLHLVHSVSISRSYISFQENTHTHTPFETRTRTGICQHSRSFRTCQPCCWRLKNWRNLKGFDCVWMKCVFPSCLFIGGWAKLWRMCETSTRLEGLKAHGHSWKRRIIFSLLSFFFSSEFHISITFSLCEKWNFLFINIYVFVILIIYIGMNARNIIEV